MSDGGAATYRRAGAGKNIARGHGVHPSTICRFEQGADYSPFAKSVKLLIGDRTSGIPALTEAYVLVHIDDVRERPTDVLLRQRKAFRFARKEVDLAIERAQDEGQSLRHLMARDADMALELVLIQTVLEERGEV